MYLTKVLIKSVCLFLLFIPVFIQAQDDSIMAKAFRSQNPNDKFSIFMENDAIVRPSIETPTYSITITVTNIRNKDGVLRFKFYDETTPFPHDKGFLRIAVPKTEVVNNTFTATYDGFTAQRMGIALLDDENDNWELDLGWVFPKEGHAFSDYYHKALRKPVYNDFRFYLTGHKSVIMKMRYY